MLHNEAGSPWWKNKRQEGRNIATSAKYRPWIKSLVRCGSRLWPGKIMGLWR